MSHKIFIIIVIILIMSNCDALDDYLDRSAIYDSPSTFLTVFDDNALSIGGIKLDDTEESALVINSKENYEGSEKFKVYLKDRRELTEDELDCLKNYLFSAALIEGYLDIICDYQGERIIHIF